MYRLCNKNNQTNHLKARGDGCIDDKSISANLQNFIAEVVQWTQNFNQEKAVLTI